MLVFWFVSVWLLVSCWIAWLCLLFVGLDFCFVCAGCLRCVLRFVVCVTLLLSAGLGLPGLLVLRCVL